MSENQRRASAEFNRRTHTKHPRWTDAEGNSRALTDHPNYSICKHVKEKADQDLILLHPWWHESISRFVYELTDEIGLRPALWWNITPNDRRLGIAPKNVFWAHRGWSKTRPARYARAAAERLQREIAFTVLAEGPPPQMSHKNGCESTWLEPIECRCCDAEREALEEW